ncbi:hepatoma-derived growth factor-related protein 3-like [Drosophila montana]|uniref:hepatoma-derived growth factor-related protein 3-like n=1 Tax=Drosophila montana TaxID=40370 RepID=UPI00313BCE5C
MSRTAIRHEQFKKGDFLFAKLKGYRPWPARVLQAGDRKYNVFFYGTCDTAEVGPKQVYTYTTCIRRLGNLQKLRQNEFKRALLHAEQAVANPAEDQAYHQTLAILENNFVDAIDVVLCDEYYLDDNVNNCVIVDDEDDDEKTSRRIC